MAKATTKERAFELFEKYEKVGKHLGQKKFCKRHRIGLSTFGRLKGKWWHEYKMRSNSGNMAHYTTPVEKQKQADKEPTELDNLREENEQAAAKIGELEYQLHEKEREFAELEQDCAILLLRKELVIYRATKESSLMSGIGALVAGGLAAFSAAKDGWKGIAK
jgi:hypothetical protein